MNRSNDVSITLKMSKQPLGKSMSVIFEDGSMQVVNPTAAFNGDWRGLAEAIAKGRPYKIRRDE